MEKRILQNESPAERLQILRDSAEKSEVYTYPKQLSSQEMDEVKNQLVKSNIDLAKLQEEKADFNEIWKTKKKPVDISLKENLQIARTRVREVTETVYLLADHDNGMMNYYNEDGFLVSSRPLHREERQLRIVDESRNGTNDY